MNCQMKASFTVEATLVLSVIFLCLVTMIMFAYQCRDNIFGNYVANEAAVRAAYLEEKWKSGNSSIDSIEESVEKRLHTVGRFYGKPVYVSKNDLSDNAAAEFDERTFTAPVADTENYMRLTSVIEDFTDNLKEGTEDE
ncbi:MAG: hypothetical protein KBS51_02145 [Lachnospiraceae bacterium]|nr:hypothetical protein [Candidatus Darwinimomas equi]